VGGNKNVATREGKRVPVSGGFVPKGYLQTHGEFKLRICRGYPNSDVRCLGGHGERSLAVGLNSGLRKMFFCDKKLMPLL
jgi:hypothetical protein